MFVVYSIHKHDDNLFPAFITKALFYTCCRPIVHYVFCPDFFILPTVTNYLL